LCIKLWDNLNYQEITSWDNLNYQEITLWDNLSYQEITSWDNLNYQEINNEMKRQKLRYIDFMHRSRILWTVRVSKKPSSNIGTQRRN